MNPTDNEQSLRQMFENIISDTLASKDGEGTWWGYDTAVDVDNAIEQFMAIYEKAILNKLNQERVAAQIDVLQRCYDDQGEIYIKHKTGFAEQYNYIATLRKEQEGEKS